MFILGRCAAVAAVTLGVAPLTGCASLTFAPKVSSVGEYKDLRQVAEKADEMPRHEDPKVKAVVGSLPEGTRLHDGVFEVDPARYELLGKVEAQLNNPTAANFGMWVYDYAPNEKWRVGYCAWQVPLSWATFTLWSIVSPTHYPCKATMGEEEARKQEIIATLRRATKALGGDVVVVDIGGTIVVQGGRGGAVVGSVEATGGVGWALRSRRGDAAAPTDRAAGAAGSREL